MILPGCTISGGRKCCRRSLQRRVVSDGEPPIVRYILCLAVFQVARHNSEQVADLLLAALVRTSQPLLTQSAKLTLVTNHKKFLFLRHSGKKVILGRELFAKLAWTEHRWVHLPAQLPFDLAERG